MPFRSFISSSENTFSCSALRILTSRESDPKILFPLSQIGAITDEQRETIIRQSRLYGQYEKTFDRESAYEMLVEEQKREEKRAKEEAEEEEKRKAKEAKEKEKAKSSKSSSKKKSTGRKAIEKTINTTATTFGRQLGKSIFRSILGGIFK